MDPVTITQRAREKEQMTRELERLNQEKLQHETAVATHNARTELQHLRERGWKAGWGDFQSWAWICFFAFVVFGAMWVACLYLTGDGTQSHWHLGYPPTRPG